MNAFLEILAFGFRGRIVRRLKNLRQPRQILAFVVGLAYMAYFVLRPFLFGGGRGGRGFPGGLAAAMPRIGEYLPAIQLALALVLAVIAVATWIGASSSPAFRFSEAEIHLLLPAPLTRRQILDFALLKQQAGILVGALVLLVFTALRWSRSPGVVLPRFFCYWGFLTLLDLHMKGVSLSKARLAELPAAVALRRRALAAGLATAWCAAVAWGLWAAWRAARAGGSWAAGELREAVLGFAGAARGGLAGIALAPFLWLAAPLAAAGAARIWGGLFLLAVLAVHYEWVVRSSARFEEAALARARRRVARGWRRGHWEHQSRLARARSPFQLEAARVPELAVTWKNLILRGRMPLARLARLTLLGLAGLAAALAGAGALGAPAAVDGGIAGTGLLLIVLMPLVAGNFLRNDLHVDFQHLETLRAWPIAGWRLIAAEILAPATALLWVELAAAGAVAAAALAAAVTGGDAGRRAVLEVVPHQLLGGASYAAALAAVLAGMVGLGLAVGLFSIALQNLAILLFPGWVPLGYATRRGTSVFGQNLIVGLGRLLGLALGAIVPFLAAALVFALLNVLLGLRFTVWELPLLALAAALPFLLEVYLMVRFAGAIWDRLDPSQELLDPAG